MSRDVTRALVAVIDEALAQLPVSPTRDAVLEVRARLLSPLRVAVAGSVSSGKSTLVNALLGQRIAPVDAGECTRLVTWFRYDHHQRIEVQRRDGSVTTVPFAPGNQLPSDLGVPVDEVARLIVHLSNERLRDLTIIDTPGLNTVTDENQRATADALGLGDATAREAGDSRVAMSDADALLFLTPHVRESDLEVLEQFRALFAASGLSAANAVGILSKVDRLAPDGDPWPVARRLSEAAKERLANVVADVVPVMGLLAETGTTDAFTEDDAFALEELAKLDELDLEDALISPQDLFDAEVPEVDRDRRRRLLSMLDLHGIAVGVELVQDGAKGAGAILRGLRQRSGVEPLSDIVEHEFTRRASALKARGGLADLRRILAQAQGEEAVVAVAMAGPLERVELDPALHDLRILDALRAVEEGSARVPEDLVESLKLLALEETPARQLGLDDAADPGEVAAAASRAVAAWARYSNDVRRTPDERRLGEDVREWYELVWDQTGVRPPRAVTATPAAVAPPAPGAPTVPPTTYGGQPSYDPNAYGQPSAYGQGYPQAAPYDPATYGGQPTAHPQGQPQPQYDPAAYAAGQPAAPAGYDAATYGSAAYDPATYAPSTYDPAAYGQFAAPQAAPAAAPAYDPNAYGQPGTPAPAPAYDPNAYGQPGTPAPPPAYDPNAYGQQPTYDQGYQTYGQGYPQQYAQPTPPPGAPPPASGPGAPAVPHVGPPPPRTAPPPSAPPDAAAPPTPAPAPAPKPKPREDPVIDGSSTGSTSGGRR